MHSLADDDPARIGPYRITALLGSGGMGRVYLGFDRDDHPAAVKVVKAEYAYDPDFRERFARELASARRVHGPGIPRVYAADTSGERPWLATAYVKGPSLQHLVEQNGPLPEPSAVYLARAIAQALTGVHAQGLAHRDLKPANTMVSAEGPQVIDFGIARAAEDGHQGDGSTLAGTPGYMAPEASRGDQAGPSADVFALGGILVWALTGSGPFGDGHPSSVLYRAENLDPELDRVPPQLRPLVAACLGKDPARRPTASQALQSLGGPVDPTTYAEQWLPPHAATAVARVAADYDRVRTLSGNGTRTRGLLVAGAATMALCLVAGFGYWSVADPFAPAEETQAADGEDEAPQRDQCDPTEHLADEFTEAASGTPTVRSDSDRVHSEFSHDGSVLAVTGTEGVSLWDWEKRTEVAFIDDPRNEGDEGAAFFSPNDCFIGWATDDGARVHSLETGELTVYAEGRSIKEISFAPDGRTLTVADFGFDAEAGTYDIDLETGETVVVHDDPGNVLSLAHSPDGAHVAGVDSIDTARIWDTETGDIVHAQDGLGVDIGQAVQLPGDGQVVFFLPEGVLHYDFVADTGEGWLFEPPEDADHDGELREFIYNEPAGLLYTAFTEEQDDDSVDFHYYIWEFDHTSDEGQDEEVDAEIGDVAINLAVHPEGDVVTGYAPDLGEVLLLSPEDLAEIDRLG
ncbi:WD40 repeat domain-containing serine/threonine protein kinase [Nocardiopsis salina]|uniref:WD40 repeat domain-containing serine/threonine protein kinase n=1 Tax=Nocardiopsis salina TaxID=245836 RepID=UPI000346A1A8|nr:WD40 repeat domain-containing serine/threonine protein kinase [Nocardiopsis salina]